MSAANFLTGSTRDSYRSGRSDLRLLDAIASIVQRRSRLASYSARKIPCSGRIGKNAWYWLKNPSMSDSTSAEWIRVPSETDQTDRLDVVWILQLPHRTLTLAVLCLRHEVSDWRKIWHPVGLDKSRALVQEIGYT